MKLQRYDLPLEIVEARDINGCLQAWFLKYGNHGAFLYLESQMVYDILVKRFNELDDTTVKMVVYYDNDILEGHRRPSRQNASLPLGTMFRKRYREICLKESYESPRT
jgi:hypothetical protein